MKLKDFAPIILVMLLLFISTACANMLIPSYATIQEEFNISASLIAIPDAFFVLVSALFALLWGYYTDRINRSKVIMAGAFSWTFGMMLTAFSNSFFMLIISRVASGAGLGCVLPVGYSIISDSIPPKERSGWFGTLAILSSLSNGAGQGLSSFVGPILSWRFPFILLSGISIIVIIVLFFVKIPQRGASEDELLELVELDLDYSYRISKKDLIKIVKKKSNRYLIIQGFFAIIPGTILVYFTTSMLSLQYFYQIPTEIRLQTSTIFAGMVGIGYILGNSIFARLGDILFLRNKKNRVRLGTICLILSIPFAIIMFLSLQPIDVNLLDINYPVLPEKIPTEEMFSFIIQTIGKIFSTYPSYIVFFIFALIGSMLAAGPVANRNAVMIDINMPEHKGTAASFFKLSEQLGKGVTLLISYPLISLLGSIFNMLFISIFFWLPAAVLWIFASKSVEKDMNDKTRILSERKQVSLIDYIFELEIQMDRAVQKFQDSKYYIFNDPIKFNQLIDDAIAILSYIEKAGESRSITKIQKKAKKLNIIATSIKQMATQIYSILQGEEIKPEERELLNEDLRQIELMISEGEKSTFGQLQIYYEDAYLKIIEARLFRKSDLTRSLERINKAIKIYERVKNLLNERIEEINDSFEISAEDQFVYEKEKELLEKCTKSLNATSKLKEKFEDLIQQLENKGIKRQDLIKISDLTLEYGIDLNKIIMETFGQDEKIKNAFLDILSKIGDIFDEYDTWKDVEPTVF
ncbi:MAG: MFS transporter [Promethearchaeota archaeon]